MSEIPYSNFLEFISKETAINSGSLVMIKAYTNQYPLDVSIAQVLYEEFDRVGTLDAIQLPPEADFEDMSRRSALLTEFAWPAMALLIAKGLLYSDLEDPFAKSLRKLGEESPFRFIDEVTEQEIQRLNAEPSLDPTWKLAMTSAIRLGRQRFYDFKEVAQRVGLG